MRRIVQGAVGAAALTLGASALADQPGPAERAVEAAKAYSGTTLTITWEAGLQALDIQAAAEWDALTQQLGGEAQRAACQDWASKLNAYPER